MKTLLASAHNAVLRAAEKRAEALEGRLVAVLEPILEQAGREAARSFRSAATDYLTASAGRAADHARVAQLGVERSREILASLALTSAGALDGVTSTSTMICVKPRPEEAATIADPDGSPADTLHVTLAYLGDVEGDLGPIADALAQVAATHAALSGVVGGYGEFRPPGCGILLPDVPGLVELRVAVTEALVASDIDYGREHGFQPHMTVDGSPEDGEIDEMLERASGQPLHFDALLIVRGDTEIVELPLVGVPAVTAAGEPTHWGKPAADEILNAKKLAERLHAKTKPVRDAVVATVMTKPLKAAGLSFDVTNPLAAKVLAGSGKHITEIASTTQADVMRIIRAAHDKGLSIPQTAELIRTGMTDAAPARAVMIARTELAGAVNGGSLAATQIVGDATGTTYLKTWLTAAGAPHPRHEDYDGLDGQTVALNAQFDVGGAMLDHPGDPDGPPEEIIQCRCTMAYEDDGQTADAEA